MKTLLSLYAFMVCLLPSISMAEDIDLAVSNYVLTESNRVSRTHFEYTYKVEIVNNDSNLSINDIEATVSSSSSYTVIIDNTVNLDTIDPNSKSVTVDTFTIRQDRRVSFDPSNLSWKFNGKAALLDSDRDGIPNVIETSLGIQSNLVDSDGDKLTDWYELVYGFPSLKPDVRDSDDNGINDGDEDTDGDGLTNLEEQTYKTSPIEKDSDGDSLDDRQEIEVYKTNPLLKDTDGDGILDGREVSNNSDPLLPDADRIVSSSSTYSTINIETQLPETVKVVITGEGDLSNKAIIRNWSDSKITGQIGRSFDISLPPEYVGKMQTAVITLPVDFNDPLSANPNNLSIYTINPDTSFWEKLPSTVDVLAGTISATTTHFSPFMVANNDSRNESQEKIPATCSAIEDPDATLVDVVLVIDSSTSMRTNDPQNLRIDAALQFIEKVKDTDRVAVVDFDYRAKILSGLTNDKDVLRSAVSRIDSSGSTNIGAGVRTAIGILTSNSDASSNRAIILLTDGEGSYDSSLTDRMADENIRVFALGLTSDADSDLLKDIASRTNGGFRNIETANDLVDIFTDLTTVFGDDGKDDDHDGLTNCQEIQGFYLPHSDKLIQTNPDNPDHDSDGVSDGAEVGALKSTINPSTSKLTWVAVNASSNPLKPDTDGDGIIDPDEYRLATNAFAKDTDGDGLEDDVEVLLHFTNPNTPDSDGDSLSDLAEIKRENEGFHPNVFNYKTNLTNRLLFMFEFLKGGLLGDVIDIDTTPELYGQLVGGFIPLADARDLVANLFKGEWFNASLSAIGIVPVFGDAISAGGRVAKFVDKFPRKRNEVTELINEHFDSPNWTKISLSALPPKVGAWTLPPLKRGKELEVKIGNFLKVADNKLIGLYGNFPKIDMWNKDIGKAVSIKTLDLDAKTYQNISSFRSTVKKYASELAEFKSALGKSVETGTKFEIMEGEVLIRELVIGVPRNLDAAYDNVIKEIMNKLKSEGSVVDIIIRVVP